MRIVRVTCLVVVQSLSVTHEVHPTITIHQQTGRLGGVSGTKTTTFWLLQSSIHCHQSEYTQDTNDSHSALAVPVDDCDTVVQGKEEYTTSIAGSL